MAAGDWATWGAEDLGDVAGGGLCAMSGGGVAVGDAFGCAGEGKRGVG